MASSNQSNQTLNRIFVGDFETTVFKNQTSTEVWASALVELYTENVIVLNSISKTFEYLKAIDGNVIVYYHNLKFDGTFWLSYLLGELNFTQACLTDENNVVWLKPKDMPNNSVQYVISDMGQWYTIKIKVNDKMIEIRDSLKLLPFSVKKIGKSFGTKHKKLEIEYEGYREANGIITEEEKKYIKNDVLVVKEALEIMYDNGHDRLTIGSCCLAEFNKGFDSKDRKMFFPNLFEMEIDEELYGSKTAGDYIRKSYKGGWCYLVKGKENKIYNNGTTADVNSLYPSMMSSESGNYYPLGKPQFWKGEIPEKVLKQKKYYFVRIRTKFYIKQNFLPFVQIKHSFLYKGNESLTTSDIWVEKEQKYYDYYVDSQGIKRQARVELTLTMTDFQLLKDHYNLVDFQILDGCWFNCDIGIFDRYIEKYKKIKLESTGAVRELAKLFLNNLYGKMASSPDSSFKYCFIKDDGSLGFKTIEAHDKIPGYIPIGSAITSYARNFTIRSAQKNYFGVEERGFIYADTDSIHCDLMPDEITGIKVHDKDFCCWKLESCWDEAIFTRQKTYIEHVCVENLKIIEEPYFNIKCAGMPQRCKDLFELSFYDLTERDLSKFSEEEIEFLQEKQRDLTDFKIGLKIPGKLMPKRIKGGTVLMNTTYEMR